MAVAGNGYPGRRVQYAALPYRVRSDGEVQVRLITSRETRRWVLPKGWPIKGLTPPKTAAREAYEEAGLLGAIGREALGMYTYEKNLGIRSVLCDVLVYPLKVKRLLQKWPERSQRYGFWFSIDSAAAAVQEEDLKALILSFGALMAERWAKKYCSAVAEAAAAGPGEQTASGLPATGGKKKGAAKAVAKGKDLVQRSCAEPGEPAVAEAVSPDRAEGASPARTKQVMAADAGDSEAPAQGAPGRNAPTEDFAKRAAKSAAKRATKNTAKGASKGAADGAAKSSGKGPAKAKAAAKAAAEIARPSAPAPAVKAEKSTPDTSTRSQAADDKTVAGKKKFAAAAKRMPTSQGREASASSGKELPQAASDTAMSTVDGKIQQPASEQAAKPKSPVKAEGSAKPKDRDGEKASGAGKSSGKSSAKSSAKSAAKSFAKSPGKSSSKSARKSSAGPSPESQVAISGADDAIPSGDCD